MVYPTVEESRTHFDELDPDPQLQVEIIKQIQKDYAGVWLPSPDELPDIEKESFPLTWDCDNSHAPSFTVISHGARLIWQEPAIYEGYDRCKEVGAIIKKKSGARLTDLVPRRRSTYDLYGDSLSANDLVEQYRRTLSGALWSLRKDNDGVALRGLPEPLF